MLVRQPVITNQRDGDRWIVHANRWMRGLKSTTLLSMPPVPLFDLLLDRPRSLPRCACELGESIEGKGARHIAVEISSVAKCVENMRAGRYDGSSCLIRDTPVPQCCPSRAVVSTSLVPVGLKRSALPLSSAQPDASATADTPR